MCGKSSDNVLLKAFQTAVERLRSAGSLLMLTHVQPDGDGLGSMIALAGSAELAGKTVHMLLPDALPHKYEFLFAARKPASLACFEELAENADAIVILDTCSFSQLDGQGDLAGGIRRWREKTIVIDHHATCDDVGAVRWIDTSAAATGVMIQELLEALSWPLGPAVAEALTTAVATDTGWLRFANTDARCLRMVAKCLEAGLCPADLYRRIYQSDRPEKLALMAGVLASLELHCGDKLAVMTIRAGDFARTGARPDETEDIVNEAMRLGSVEAAVLLVEQADCVRASLRSRGAIDVAKVANRFGGGGHARAAGCRGKGDLDALKQHLIDACAEALSEAD